MPHSEPQAARLTRTAAVLAVTTDDARALHTSSAPDFPGLAGPSGVWATKAKGEEAFRRFAQHLVEAVAELEKVPVKVFNREFVDRAL